MDVIDGREVPPLVVTADHELIGVHEGTVIVKGGHTTIRGKLKGTLSVRSGSTVTVFGVVQGTLSVERDASVRVIGAQEGSTSVEEDGTLIVEDGAKLAGSLHNDGTTIVRGVFGGPQSGRSSVILEGRGHIKPPDEIKDGVTTYRW